MRVGWRSDKRPKISPYVPAWVHRRVHELANFIRVSDGDAANMVIITAFEQDHIIERLVPYLLREYTRHNTIWIGRKDHMDLDQLINPKGEYCPRFHTRVTQEYWMLIDELGHALGRGAAPAAAVLLVQGLQDRDTLDAIDPAFGVLRRIRIGG